VGSFRLLQYPSFRREPRQTQEPRQQADVSVKRRKSVKPSRRIACGFANGSAKALPRPGGFVLSFFSLHETSVGSPCQLRSQISPRCAPENADSACTAGLRMRRLSKPVLRHPLTPRPQHCKQCRRSSPRFQLRQVPPTPVRQDGIISSHLIIPTNPAPTTTIRSRRRRGQDPTEGGAGRDRLRTKDQ
jgi:hypothetical protein